MAEMLAKGIAKRFIGVEIPVGGGGSYTAWKYLDLGLRSYPGERGYQFFARTEQALRSAAPVMKGVGALSTVFDIANNVVDGIQAAQRGYRREYLVALMKNGYILECVATDMAAPPLGTAMQPFVDSSAKQSADQVLSIWNAWDTYQRLNQLVKELQALPPMRVETPDIDLSGVTEFPAR
jgi:hypothetical protein